MVHKDFACVYSPVLKAALNNTDSVESQIKTYHFENISEKVLRLLIYWIYCQDLDIIDLKPMRDAFKVVTKLEENMHLAKLWILADQLLIPRLQNDAMEKIEHMSHVSGLIATNCFKFVYQNTDGESALRKLYVHQSATQLDKSFVKDYPYIFPKDMLIDIIEFLTNTHTQLAEIGANRDIRGFRVMVEGEHMHGVTDIEDVEVIEIVE